MQKNETYSEIFAYLLTPHERDLLVSEIEFLLAQGDENSTLGHVFTDKNISIFLYDFLNKKKEKISTQMLTELAAEINKIPTVGITLSFIPSRKFAEEIQSLIQSHLGKTIVLDITVNKTILGGIILEIDGKYADLSLQKSIQVNFENKGDLILKLVH